MIGTTIAIFECEEELKTKHLNNWGGVFLLAKKISTDTTTLKDIPQIITFIEIGQKSLISSGSRVGSKQQVCRIAT